jgi:hypothetical protein
MNRLGKFLAVFFTVLMVIDIAALQLIYPAKSRIRESTYYLDKFEKKGLYDELYSFLSKNVEGVIADKQISGKITGEVVSREWVVEEINSFTAGLLSYLRNESENLPVIDYDPVTQKLVENIQGFINEIGLRPQTLADAMISSLKDSIDKALVRAPFSSKWDEGKRDEFKASLKKPRWALTNMDLAVKTLIYFIPLLLILILLTAGIKPFPLKLAASGILAGGIVAVLLSLLLNFNAGALSGKLLSSLPPEVALGVPSIQSVAQSVIKDASNSALISGGIIGAAGIVLIIISSRKKRRFPIQHNQFSKE